MEAGSADRTGLLREIDRPLREIDRPLREIDRPGRPSTLLDRTEAHRYNAATVQGSRRRCRHSERIKR